MIRITTIESLKVMSMFSEIRINYAHSMRYDKVNSGTYEKYTEL